MDVDKSNLKFEIVRDDKNIYDIYFSGVIEFTLSPKEKTALEKQEFDVTVWLNFGEASDGEEYEYIELTGVVLEDFEAL